MKYMEDGARRKRANPTENSQISAMLTMNNADRKDESPSVNFIARSSFKIMSTAYLSVSES